MANIFRRQVYPSKYAGEAEIGREIYNIGVDLQRAENNKRMNADLTAYNVQVLKFQDEIDRIRNENKSEPYKVNEQIKKLLPEWQKQIGQISTYAGSREEIKNRFSQQMQSWDNSINEWERRQEDYNETINHKIIKDNYEKSRQFGGREELVQHLQQYGDSEIGFARSGTITFKQADDNILDMTRTHVASYAMQHPDKTDEKGVKAEGYYIEHPNELIGELNLFGEGQLKQPLFGPEEIAELRDRYRTARTAGDRLAKLELENQQDENHRKVWADIKDGKLTDPTVITKMVRNNELPSPGVGETLIKLMGAGPGEEDDPQAVRQANKIVNAVENGETKPDEGFIELVKLAPKLKKTTMSSKVNDFSDAEDIESATKREPAASYIKSFKEIVFEEAAESTEGMIFYDKGMRALRDFAKKNPDATPEQWAKFYTALVEPFLADWTFGPFRRNWGKVSKKTFGTKKTEEEDLSKMTDEQLMAIINEGE